MKAVKLADDWYMVLWFQIRRFNGRMVRVEHQRTVKAKSKHDAVMQVTDRLIKEST